MSKTPESTCTTFGKEKEAFRTRWQNGMPKTLQTCSVISKMGQTNAFYLGQPVN